MGVPYNTSGGVRSDGSRRGRGAAAAGGAASPQQRRLPRFGGMRIIAPRPLRQGWCLHLVPITVTVYYDIMLVPQVEHVWVVAVCNMILSDRSTILYHIMEKYMFTGSIRVILCCPFSSLEFCDILADFVVVLRVVYVGETNACGCMYGIYGILLVGHAVTHHSATV